MADKKHRMIYNEEWVMQRKNHNHGLQPLKKILENCGNPQNQICCIHIAGTNGKGSTTNYLKDILVSKGYRVGMFTSPHLVAHRDRMRINDVWITEDVFHAYLMKHLKEIVENDLGMFEIDTLIAYEWFCDQHVDYALIETGLGGRLDSTNLIHHPRMCLITSIGFDHMQILGTRIEQIAFEKAGIIMPHSLCVLAKVDGKADCVIRHVARRKQARVVLLPKLKSIGNRKFVFDGDVYHLSTSALYQIQNASLALYASKLLEIDIHTKEVKQAIEKSMWKGRFETICQDPCVILDGAHNTEGIEALCMSMQQLKKPVICVFSALKDKQVHQMAYLLKTYSDTLIVTQFENERADRVEDLFIDGAVIEKSYVQAIQKGMVLGKDGTVVVTGSLYFISKVRESFEKGDIQTIFVYNNSIM